MTPQLDSLWLWPLVAAPAIGSFLGVLAERLPAGRAIALARSACDHCGHALAPRDLVPILSWAVQRGRCRYCGVFLGLFYPGIELLCVGAVLWAALALPLELVWAGSLLGWWLIALSAIDRRAMLLPDALTLPLVLAGLAVTYLVAPGAVVHHAGGALAGFALIAAVGWAYRRLRGRDGIGLGDAKLAAAAGAWVSWSGLPSVILIASLSGIAFVVLSWFLGSRQPLEARIPFGPHLAVGIWIVWLHGPVLIA